jgi:hypothetical protein
MSRVCAELIFACDLSKLLGCRHVLTESHPFATAGALHSWTSNLQREIVDDLLAGPTASL